MEAAIALFATMGTTAAAGTAAAGTAAAATSAAAWAAGTTITTAAGVTTSLAAGSTALGVMQGLATAGSMISTIMGGVGALAEGRQNARMAELQGDAEALASQENALRIKREMLQKTGDARVAFAASGLDISSADAVVNDLEQQGNFETGIERRNGEMRRMQAGLRAKAYRTQGTMNLVSSLAKAGGQFANYGLDVAQRG